jgi:hypothetical protein
LILFLVERRKRARQINRSLSAHESIGLDTIGFEFVLCASTGSPFCTVDELVRGDATKTNGSREIG